MNGRARTAEEGSSAEPARRDGRKTRGQREGSLVDEVRQRILDDIITGDMKPSSVVQLGALADRYGVSKTPVREALTALEGQGLITSLPYKGYMVRPVEPSDVYDVYLVRRVIEGAAAEIATDRLAPETLEDLASMRPPQVEKMTLEYDEYAREFHRTIVAASGSTRLLVLFDNIYNDVRRLQYCGIGNPRPDLIHSEHDEIVNALKMRDAAVARRLMEDHISAIQQRAVRDWMHSPTR